MLMKEPTLADMLMEAARRLSRVKPRFTPEDLAVQAWLIYPAHFSIKGFGQKYPDNNKVNAALYGKNRLIGKNKLHKKDGLIWLPSEGEREVAERRVTA